MGWAQQKLASLEEEGAVMAYGIFVLFFFSLNINKSRTGVSGPLAVSHQSAEAAGRAPLPSSPYDLMPVLF